MKKNDKRYENQSRRFIVPVLGITWKKKEKRRSIEAENHQRSNPKILPESKKHECLNWKNVMNITPKEWKGA